MTNKLTIPFGINKGKDPGEVSDSWFLLMYSRGLLSGKLKRYAEERISSLKFKTREKSGSKTSVMTAPGN